MNRRDFVIQTNLLSAGFFLYPLLTNAAYKTNPTILIVSGWQDVNIGDI
jgi:hypothetical protein